MFRLFEKLEKDEVYVIAEMSANHGGSLENALQESSEKHSKTQYQVRRPYRR